MTALKLGIQAALEALRAMRQGKAAIRMAERARRTREAQTRTRRRRRRGRIQAGG